MALQLFKEALSGKYDGFSPETLLAPGSVVNAQNMRKVSKLGGWRSRRGTVLNNTTQIAAAQVNQLIQYTHPRNADYHFIAQCNSLFYEATNQPPSSGTTFGTAYDIATGTTPTFSDIVREHLFIGDGEGVPIVWGGDTPFCSGFVCGNDISGTEVKVDFTREVIDNKTTTYAALHDDADDVIYILTPERITGIKLTFVSGHVNSNTATVTIKAYRAGTYTTVSNASDGTASGGATFAQTGTITFDFSSSDDMAVIDGYMGYAYKISFSAALSSGIQISKCQVVFKPQRMTNKWNGIFEWCAGARFYDNANGIYDDCGGLVTNESTSQYMQIGGMTSSDYVYIKSVEPLCGIGIGMDLDYANTAAAKLDNIEYWDGDEWQSHTTFDDGTLDTGSTDSFAQTGTLWWNAAADAPKMRTFDWDSVPGYWYRISTASGTIDADVRIWGILLAAFPEALGPTDGCIEFKGRLFTWGDPEYPNRLRFSAKDKPDCFTGSDSGWTEEIGNMDEILCVKRFYNELLIWKKKSMFLLEGYSPQTFGTTRVAEDTGLASPQTAKIIEVGYPGIHRDEPLTIAIWQDTDGIYAFDGRKPKKISQDIEHYFNHEYFTGTAIPAAQLENRFAFLDKKYYEYHFCLSDGELVYNFVNEEWYPKWDRAVDLTCGLELEGTDGRDYSYGGSATGFVWLTEYPLALGVDKDTSNDNVNITSTLKTRAISATQKMSPTLEFTFRRTWLEAKTLTSGTLTTKFYKDLASTGTALATPTAMSLVRSGYDLAIPDLDTNQIDVSCFQLEYIADGLDLEVYSFLFALDATGELDVG